MTNATLLAAHVAGWVDQPNGRGTQDILWACFLTVFVCTWTILHLNLPAATDGYWRIAARKARWMTAAVLVPEVVTASAFAQRVAAGQAMDAMRLLNCPWSLTQAFYLNMGGVWLQPRSGDAFPINGAREPHQKSTNASDLELLSESTPEYA